MEKNNRKDKIAHALVEAREKKGLKKTEVARLASMPYTTYASYEAGHRLADVDTLRKIAPVLSVKWQSLLGFKFWGFDENGNEIWADEKPANETIHDMLKNHEEHQEVIQRTVENMNALTLSAKKQVEAYSKFLLQDAGNVQPEIDINAYGYIPNAEKQKSPDGEASED